MPLIVIAAGLVALAVAAGLDMSDSRTTRTAAAVPVVDRGSLPAPGPSPSMSRQRDPTDPSRLRSNTVRAGSRLVYQRLGIRAPITDVQVVGAVMQVPLDPQTLGWWSGGAAPGDTSGSVVVVGHINYAGTRGALAVLPQARPGDRIDLDEPHGTDHAYRVQAVRTYPKTSGIPQDAFDRAGAPRLVLITCGGPFDPGTGNYEDNIVVYAVPD